ncbi:hypothetical protein BO83DRAFT_80351 [Aspergillus eucalypticola CBS 122712]|uniref:Uncharacterized protein n=1 Tax=Aspergillus eucalypticola (strain CBS 122712 / IBT 29274) TaxID=1448314 RepID=A0A317WDR6_ASPEC|nr:uncharacterized protein BO83DRAFT_80351 [Aspergillus eucalypticola CBS 122712]PWY84115.1 hypothetical protein BO83DRAFT_80351 [Aspergillus eucalypticola CBS 122712]
MIRNKSSSGGHVGKKRKNPLLLDISHRKEKEGFTLYYLNYSRDSVKCSSAVLSIIPTTWKISESVRGWLGGGYVTSSYSWTGCTMELNISGQHAGSALGAEACDSSRTVGQTSC